MPQYVNPYQAQTPIGQGLQSIAAALMSGPSATEKAAIDLSRSQFEDQRLKRTADQSIADLLAQSQQLAGQTEGLIDSTEDTGLQGVLRGIPLAAAKYAAPAGGIDPQQARTIYAALSQYGGEDMLRRSLPLLGSVPGRDTALTTGRADELREASVADAIKQALGSNVVEVADPTSPTGLVYQTRGQAVEQASPAAKTGVGADRLPLDVSPRDVQALYSMIEDAAGIRYLPKDQGGGIGPSGAAPLSPDAMNKVLARTSELYQSTRNAQTAANQALRELGGLTTVTEGASSGIPFVPGFLDPWQTEGTSQQIFAPQTTSTPTPATGGMMTEMPLPSDPRWFNPATGQPRVIKNPATGERFISDGKKIIPAGA